jgi:hypothetical protein
MFGSFRYRANLASEHDRSFFGARYATAAIRKPRALRLEKI